MSGDEDEDLGSIAWPGFVDILSSVIIMFVFFVLVVASALYFHIIIFKSKILSEVSESISAQSQSEELASTNRSLMKKIEEMTEKMKLLEKMTQDNDIQLYKEDSEFAESQDQTIEEDIASKTIIVFFGKDSISVTKENQEQIAAAIKKYTKEFSPQNTNVSLLSGKDPDSLNDVVARRLAVARMLNVRNSFLDSKIPSDQVLPTVSDKEDIEGSYNWVKITFSKK